jgi:carboxyvinyl-carboxyphosphonate phosphorylmutase
MPVLTFTQRREAFRALLQRPQVMAYGSVWDPVSARIVESLGFEVGMLGGSIASHAVLGSPDLVVLTLTEFALQIQRISRAASTLPVLVDADHGYGTALNVVRTVEELEVAGVSGLTIEDTVLPRRYAGPEGELIPREEFRDKLRAAVYARVDPALVIIGRVGGLARTGMDETMARVRLAEEAGVDAVFVLGAAQVEQVQALHEATHLPLMLNAAPADYEQMAGLGARIILQGHLQYFVAMKALYDAFAIQRKDGPNAVPRELGASAELQAIALAEPRFKAQQSDFMGL